MWWTWQRIHGVTFHVFPSYFSSAFYWLFAILTCKINPKCIRKCSICDIFGQLFRTVKIEILMIRQFSLQKNPNQCITSSTFRFQTSEAECETECTCRPSPIWWAVRRPHRPPPLYPPLWGSEVAGLMSPWKPDQDAAPCLCRRYLCPNPAASPRPLVLRQVPVGTRGQCPSRRRHLGEKKQKKKNLLRMFEKKKREKNVVKAIDHTVVILSQKATTATLPKIFYDILSLLIRKLKLLVRGINYRRAREINLIHKSWRGQTGTKWRQPAQIIAWKNERRRRFEPNGLEQLPWQQSQQNWMNLERAGLKKEKEKK